MNTIIEVLDAYVVKHNQVERLKYELEQAKKRLELFDKILSGEYLCINDGNLQQQEISDKVSVIRANGETAIDKSSAFHWGKTGSSFDIIAYKYI